MRVRTKSKSKSHNKKLEFYAIKLKKQGKKLKKNENKKIQRKTNQKILL